MGRTRKKRKIDRTIVLDELKDIGIFVNGKFQIRTFLLSVAKNFLL